MRECPKCGEPLSAGTVVCSVCGARWIAPSSIDRGLYFYVVGPALSRLAEWRQKYGLVPLLSTLGLLPLFPVTPLLGIVLGTAGLFEVKWGTAPDEGRPLAALGLLGGLVWMMIGMSLTGSIASWLAKLATS
jgi:hypothetical protein